MRILKITLFVVILIFLSLNNIKAQQGFFLDNWESKTIENPSVFNEIEKSTKLPDVQVTINFADTLNKVPKYIYGNNANTYSTIMWNNAKLVEDLRNLNPHVLRYPGGNLSNEYFWDRTPYDKPSDIPNDIGVWYGMDSGKSTLSIDNYYRLLDSTNSTGIICINYGYARYGTSSDPVAQAAHYAAEWVRYDNGRTKFWEIGNENYGEWNKGYQIDTSQNQDNQPEFINGKLYGEHGLIFVDSMKAAANEIGHEIFIGFQAYELETSYDPIQTVWNEKMMPVVGDVPDFYIVHSYFTNYEENSNANAVLESYKKTRVLKSQVEKDLAEFGLDPKPIALTEYNIFAVGSKQMISHINGMHSVIVLGEAIRYGYGMVNRWNLANNYEEGNDHGTFSRNDPDVNDFTPYPAFYHLTFFQKYFGDHMVNSDVSKNTPAAVWDILAFASSFESGQAGITLVNKTADLQVVQLNLNNFEAGERIYWFQLQDEKGTGAFSSKVFINGEGPDQVSGGPGNYLNIAPYSFTTDDTIKIDCPPFSAIYMLVEGETVVGVEDNYEENLITDFKLLQNYPNPFNPVTKINYSIAQAGKVKLNVFDLLGRKVAELLSENQPAGNHEVIFDASNVSSGIYFYRMSYVNSYGSFSESKKMTILK